jgi:hypothetical protein
MDNKKENIMISEQDVFNFVFFKESLPKEKQSIIEKDNSYKDMLDFYTILKHNSIENPDEALKKSLASKIAAYSLSNVIHLYC